jgi:hypothetical protein
LDNIIGKLVEQLAPTEKEEWAERVKAQATHAEEEAVVKKLQTLINTAKCKNLKFLSITDSWTLEERKTFLDGVG